MQKRKRSHHTCTYICNPLSPNHARNKQEKLLEITLQACKAQGTRFSIRQRGQERSKGRNLTGGIILRPWIFYIAQHAWKISDWGILSRELSGLTPPPRFKVNLSMVGLSGEVDLRLFFVVSSEKQWPGGDDPGLPSSWVRVYLLLAGRGGVNHCEKKSLNLSNHSSLFVYFDNLGINLLPHAMLPRMTFARGRLKIGVSHYFGLSRR